MQARNPVVIHWAHDMRRAIAFYEEALDLRVRSESPAWTVLDLGPIQLALHLVDPGSGEGPLPNAGLNVEVDDVDGLAAVVARLGGSVTKVIEPTPGLPLRVALLRDCEGNGFEARQPVAP